MTQVPSSYTTVITASKDDQRVVAGIVSSLQAAQAPTDSGAALLAAQPPARSPIEFSARAFKQPNGTGTWVKTRGSDPSAILVYLHGRRFQFDEPADVFAPRLSVATGLEVLKLGYRLAPGFPYPAALEDVLAVYEALLQFPIPASRIVLLGHSSGATLALSAAIELAASRRPLPAAVIALSAITDFTYSGQSMRRNDKKDVISWNEALQVRSAYLGDADPSQSPQSPLWGTLDGLPPTLLACGGNELFLDDSVRFAAAARSAGVEAWIDIFEDMPHAFSVMRLDASAIVLERVGDFVRAQLARIKKDV